MNRVLTSAAKCVLLASITSTTVIGASVWAQPNYAFAEEAPAASGTDQVVFTMDSNEILVNGVLRLTDNPITVTKGVSYIQFKTIAQIFGFKVSYDKATKESVATNDQTTIRFKLDSDVVRVNGKQVKAVGSTYTKNGSLMVPIRTWANLTNSKIGVANKQVTLTWQTAPVATFSVNEQRIVAGETTVTYKDLASSPSGYTILDEEWIGKETVFATPGSYEILRRVMDARGVWSPYYSVTIHVEKPNEPPVAAFVTNKDTYKQGEPVIYTNQSTDDGKIVRSTWSGNEPAFFESGTHTIQLEVQDDFGLTNSISKTIRVTDEMMYSKDQFYLNFSKVGDKMPFVAHEALGIPSISYDIQDEDVTSVRTNSPELLMGAGLDYEDTIGGTVRFNIHKKNGITDPLRLHLLATNDNTETAYIDTANFSLAGPANYVSTSGKTAVTRYLSQLLNPPESKWIAIEPGQTIELIPNASNNPIKHTQTMTIFAEFHTMESLPLRFSLIVTDPKADPIQSLKELPQSAHDNKHVRGTFKNGNRMITSDHLFGSGGKEKLVVGDQSFDKALVGVDAVTGQSVLNFGNGGVLYRFKLAVAANTAVLLNPRGGHYAGAFIVNDKVVQLTSNSILRGQNEAGMLHRTGERDELVEMAFLVAPGSNMPLNIMFLPLPDLNTPQVQTSVETGTTDQQTSTTTP